MNPKTIQKKITKEERKISNARADILRAKRTIKGLKKMLKH